MKRVLKTTIAAIMAVAVLAGCTMKENVGIKIGSDKKVSASVTIAYDKEFIDGLISMNGTSADAITEEMRWEAAKSEDDMEGFTATKVTEEGMYGYVFTKELGNIDTLSTEDSTAERVNFSDDDFFTSKLFIKDGNKYKSNMKIKMDDNSASQVSQIQQGNGTIEVKLVIELPNKAISNNANEVSEDGKTLSYDLLKTSDIDFEFSFDSAETKAKSGTSTAAATKNSNMIVYIGIGGACVVAIIAVIIVMFSKKGKVEAAPVQTIAPAAPVAPVAPVAPAAPEVPAAPVAPVEPVAPAAPVMPEVPAAPAEPVVPAAPAAPETTQDTTINQ